MKDLHSLVYDWPTKHKQGFIQSEIDELLSRFDNLHMDKWHDAMMGNTCMLDEEDGFITYHIDVLTALRCAIDNRKQTWLEFD